MIDKSRKISDTELENVAGGRPDAFTTQTGLQGQKATTDVGLQANARFSTKPLAGTKAKPVCPDCMGPVSKVTLGTYAGKAICKACNTVFQEVCLTE